MDDYNIVALNGSPRARQSNTDRLLKPFLAGAAQAGAQSEILYAAELDVKDCLGCFCCWNKTPGHCVLKDGMAPILDKIKTADLVIWATPLYHYGMTARLKRILERTLPLWKPYIVNQNGRYSHPPRYPESRAAYLLMSNCGFPERRHFDALVEQFRQMGENESRLLGAVLCPAGEVLAHMDADWYFDALRDAGREIVTAGRIMEPTAATLAKDFIPLDSFLQMANASWKVPGEVAPTLAEAMSGEYPNRKTRQ